MVAYLNRTLRRPLQAMAWQNPLPFFIRITPPASGTGAVATFV